MVKLLIKTFIPNASETENLRIRAAYGMLAGVMGIVCNLFLFIVKLIAGTLTHSIAITSDAFNNLSDMGSSLISAVTAKLSGQRPDAEHPFGHGRLEYIASLAVSFLIMLVGFELFRSSAAKIFAPEPVIFSWPALLILLISTLVKVWMFSYNRYIGKTIQSGVLRAAASDSLNDAAATGAVIVATIAARYVNFPIDGIMGILVSLLILRAGYGIAKETIGLLLGSPPDAELVRRIEALVLSGEGIVGVHDLIVHDYGPGRTIASVHAEVPDDSDIVRIHEIIDAIEQRALEELGLVLVIHMDPITINNERVDTLHKLVSEVITSVEPSYKTHDFRVTDGDERINVIFDMEVPISQKPEQISRNLALIRERAEAADARIRLVVKVDQGMQSD